MRQRHVDEERLSVVAQLDGVTERETYMVREFVLHHMAMESII